MTSMSPFNSMIPSPSCPTWWPISIKQNSKFEIACIKSSAFWSHKYWVVSVLTIKYFVHRKLSCIVTNLSFAHFACIEHKAGCILFLMFGDHTTVGCIRAEYIDSRHQENNQFYEKLFLSP